MAINLSQQRFLQPLRSNVLGSYELAIEALNKVASEIVTKGLSTKADGSTIVARYNTKGEGNEGNEVKSIFGIFHGATGKITIYSADVDKISEIEREIDITKAAATKLKLVDGETKLNLTSVTSEDGEITYTLSSVNVASAQGLADEIERATNAEEDLDARLDVIEGEAEGSIKKAVADAKSALLGDAAEEYNTLGKLEDKIQKAVADAKSYSIAKVEGTLGANVKEAFKLVDEDGVQAGATISIYKDSSLKEVKLDGQILNFTYILADGTESTVGVDVSTFLAESEFENGLQVNEHIVSVKIDATSEDFLTVSKDGVKLSGVQSAIDAAKAAIKGTLVDGDSKTLEEVNSELNGLDQEINALKTDKNFVKAVNVNGVEATISENKATVTIDGSDVSLSTDYANADYTNVTSANLTAVNDGDSIDAAISKLESNIVKLTKEVLDNESVCSAAITKLNEELGFDENAKFVVCEGAKHMAGASSVSDALCKLDTAIEAIKNGASGELDNAIKDLDVTDAAVEGQIVVSVSQTDGKVSNVKANLKDIVFDSEVQEGEEKVTLGDKISEIEKTITDNKAECDAAAAAATTEVVQGTTNPMLSVTKDETAADGHVKYTIDLADSWDCGTFEYTEQE